MNTRENQDFRATKAGVAAQPLPLPHLQRLQKTTTEWRNPTKSDRACLANRPDCPSRPLRPSFFSLLFSSARRVAKRNTAQLRSKDPKAKAYPWRLCGRGKMPKRSLRSTPSARQRGRETTAKQQLPPLGVRGTAPTGAFH